MESIVEACTCSARSASSKNSDVSAPVLEKIQDIQEISFYDNCMPYSICQSSPTCKLSSARECQTKPGRVWPRLTKHFDLLLVFQHLPSGLTLQVRDVLCSDLIIMSGLRELAESLVIRFQARLSSGSILWQNQGPKLRCCDDQSLHLAFLGDLI